MLNIVLADDQQLVTSAISTLLQGEGHNRIIGEASRKANVIALVRSVPAADLLIIEPEMPEGHDIIKEVFVVNPGIKVIGLSRNEHPQAVAGTFALGASAYLLKQCRFEELQLAIRSVMMGGSYVCKGLLMQLLERIKKNSIPAKSNLIAVQPTPRELEVLELIADGKTNSEIAELLFLSRRTVEGHRQQLLEKTGTKNTAQLIKYVMSRGILS